MMESYLRRLSKTRRVTNVLPNLELFSNPVRKTQCCVPAGKPHQEVNSTTQLYVGKSSSEIVQYKCDSFSEDVVDLPGGGLYVCVATTRQIRLKEYTLACQV